MNEVWDGYSFHGHSQLAGQLNHRKQTMICISVWRHCHWLWATGLKRTSHIAKHTNVHLACRITIPLAGWNNYSVPVFYCAYKVCCPDNKQQYIIYHQISQIIVYGTYIDIQLFLSVNSCINFLNLYLVSSHIDLAFKKALWCVEFDFRILSSTSLITI